MSSLSLLSSLPSLLRLPSFPLPYPAPASLESPPLRSDRNAIQRPSGDHCGELSCADCVSCTNCEDWESSAPPAVLYSQSSLRKIWRSQSALSVSMTTEFPSGETFISGKLTELKKSSRVSLGFAFCASAKLGWVKKEIETKSPDKRRDNRPIDLSLNNFQNYEIYTARAVDGNAQRGCPSRVSASWRGRLRVAKCILEWLTSGHALFYNPPPVVVAAEGN